MMRLNRLISLLGCCAVLSACQWGPAPGRTLSAIDQELLKATAPRPPAKAPEQVLQALMPPVARLKPTPSAVPEYRFDLSVANASPAQVYQAIASGSRYNILLSNTLPGAVTISLKDVTVKEALDTLRELYGYEYRIDGNRVIVQAAALSSRIFQVSYPAARRVGRSDTRVTSGSIMAAGQSGGTSGATSQEGSQVSTSTDADFWKELDTSLKAIVGTEGGRQVVLSQQTGVVVVKGFPRDIAEVERFLRASKLAVERQVMLEAKIVEVTLKDGFESGINWGSLSGNNHRFSVGADAGRINVPGSIGKGYGLEQGSISTIVTDTTVTPSKLGEVLAAPASAVGSGLLGMAFTSNGFIGLLSFLETQGTVHVLSSPRVAAVNNQKALLRVGTDDFFITNVSTTITSSASGNITTPSITVQPFFSGISLDVTPQIDEDGMVTLHIRPSVSNVTERTKVVNLGTLGSFSLPLASSNINETDTVVRMQDGVIVAIGGLMQQAQTSDDNKVPGAGDVPVVGNLFSRKDRRLEKRELVFLLKPTIIKGEAQWAQDVANTQQRLSEYSSAPITAKSVE
jgi:MSHA biogenesis protein MshL